MGVWGLDGGLRALCFGDLASGDERVGYVCRWGSDGIREEGEK